MTKTGETEKRTLVRIMAKADVAQGRKEKMIREQSKDRRPTHDSKMGSLSKEEVVKNLTPNKSVEETYREDKRVVRAGYLR